MEMPPITVYTTAPASTEREGTAFRRNAIDVARWTERAGYRGLLVYTDNTLVDPWAASQLIISRTDHVVPLVAVQPVYMHPYSVARFLSTLQFIYGRAVDLNFVTGGFAQHMQALGCTLSHDERYDRLSEYVDAVRRLVSSGRPTSFAGAFYQLHGATISPRADTTLPTMMYISGSSPASLNAQRRLGLTRLAYPRLISAYEDPAEALRDSGIRVGVIARSTADEAWREARRRFPCDHLGEQLHDIAAKVVESHWHQHQSAAAQQSHLPIGPYWLYPFRTYKTFCPYLVGDYTDVASFLVPYLQYGVSTMVLDVPEQEDDLHHTSIAIRAALAGAAVGPDRTGAAALPSPEQSTRPVDEDLDYAASA
jgi:alkanesulfonate monooxygenase